ncbi:UNVERIFIED_CONTAM: hypothetical protein GTU68_009978 [Idotea baltica]|nr:hypothetical protein [Idotea baltica]
MDIGVRRVFLLARAEWDDQRLYKRTPQDQIREENIIHRDIIQGNFKEHYHNLTYKHVMGLQWVNTFCSQAKYIIKMDDDIIVDIYRFTDILKYRYINRSNLMVGFLIIGGIVIRDRKSKYYVKENEFGGKIYPNYMSGWAYAISSDASKKIVDISQNVTFFWLDDVYVSGILADAAGVKKEGINRMYTKNSNYLRCCVKYKDYLCDYMVGSNSGSIRLMEKLLQHARNCHTRNCTERPFRKVC